MKPLHNPIQLNLFRSSRFITTGEAAAMLKVSVGTVYNLITQEELHSYQRGRRGWNMVSLDSVHELMQKWALEAFGTTNSHQSQDSALTKTARSG